MIKCGGSKMHFCPNCGVKITNKVNFCPNCGQKLNSIVETTVSTTKSENESDNRAVVGEKKVQAAAAVATKRN